jgi:hypothetical protein
MMLFRVDVDEMYLKVTGEPMGPKSRPERERTVPPVVGIVFADAFVELAPETTTEVMLGG